MLSILFMPWAAVDMLLTHKNLIKFFFVQAAEHLQSFIADCDRRTELAKKRLAETQDEISAEVTAKVTSTLLTLLL